MNKKELVKQTDLAFDFLQKLYLEVSYLIKEIEGLLAEEEENFIIGRGSGYAITARSSNGLEANNVHLWPLRTFSVFFVPQEMTKVKSGATVTRFLPGLKTILLKFVLNKSDISEPYIYVGTLYEMVAKKETFIKFENLITHIEYNQKKIFTGDDFVDYEDGYLKFKGKFIKINLYDINSSEEIVNLVLEPALKIFRNIDLATKN